MHTTRVEVQDDHAALGAIGADAHVEDPRIALRAFLVLDASVRLTLYAGALTLALVVLGAAGAWPEESPAQGGLGTAFGWAKAVVLFIVLFNLSYVLLLIAFRLPIPQPREGRYAIGRGRPIPAALIFSCLIATLTKARYYAPFPGFLVFHAANLPPLCWFMSAIFGPKSASCYVTEPMIIDPHLVTIGRNVVIGLDTKIAGHYQDRDGVVLKRTVIEDNVLIGARCSLFCGVHIKKGAVIGAGSILLPGTIVGENEYWSGNPARRRKEFASADEPEGAAAP